MLCLRDDAASAGPCFPVLCCVLSKDKFTSLLCHAVLCPQDYATQQQLMAGALMGGGMGLNPLSPQAQLQVCFWGLCEVGWV